MREWLAIGAIPDDTQLAAELTGPQYGYVDREGGSAILLESKKDMKGRGLASPDLADALALTFAYPVVPRRRREDPDPAHLIETEYDPFNHEEAA
jgi:hypothetical protein